MQPTNETNQTNLTALAPSASSPAWWAHPPFWAVVVVVGYAALLALASWVLLASGDERKRRLRAAGTHAINVIVLSLLSLTWVYRFRIGDFSTSIWTWTRAIATWYWAQPLWDKVWMGGLFAAFVFEVIYVDIYLILHRLVWRSIFPDLVLIRGGNTTPTVVGRIYRVENGMNGRPHRYHFAPHYSNPFTWMGQLHVVETPLSLQRVNGFQRGIHATRLIVDRTTRRTWRVGETGMRTQPVHADGTDEIVDRSLTENRHVSTQGIEGNPHILASRASKETTNRTRVHGWRRGSQSPTPMKEGSQGASTRTLRPRVPTADGGHQNGQQ